MYSNKLVAIFPTKAIVKNNGFGDNLGINCGYDYRFRNLPYYTGEKLFHNPPEVKIFNEIDALMRKTYQYDTIRYISHFLHRNGIKFPKSLKNAIKKRFKI